MYFLLTVILAELANWKDALVGFLPIAMFLAILFLLFRRQTKSPVAKRQKAYLERQIEHSRRVEELLERIAKALEKDRSA